MYGQPQLPDRNECVTTREHLPMSDVADIAVRPNSKKTSDIEDAAILCIDCGQTFVWTAGEQIFFRDKRLENPPKRCKECKKAKTRRLEAIELAAATGKRQRVEVQAKCAKCECLTTVPFYPSQGRPVYCRACFIETNVPHSNGAASPN